MATGRKQTPDFFDNDGLDPVETATGYLQNSPKDKAAPSIAAAKAGPAGEPCPRVAPSLEAMAYVSVDIPEPIILPGDDSTMPQSGGSRGETASPRRS